MIYHEYECIYVARPELGEEEVTRLHARVETAIGESEGRVLVSEDWGQRKLAYPIKRHNFGVYRYLNYVANGETPSKVERIIRLEDNLIRFITVKLADSVDPDNCQEIAEARQAKRVAQRELEAAEAAARAERWANSDNKQGDSSPSRDDSDGNDDASKESDVVEE